MKAPAETSSGRSARWVIDDEVIRLREWASDVVFPLVAEHRKSRTIGTEPTCAIHVGAEDPRIAPAYARFEHLHGMWTIVDAGTEHGILIDGVRCARADLRPGLEISLGGALTLVAESPRLIALRELLCRLLGW